MAKNIILLALSVALILIGAGCKQAAKVETLDDWSYLTITTEESTVISIRNADDTTTVKFYDGGGFFTGFHKVKVDSLKTHFTMAEKDSLFHLAREIVSKPVRRIPGCTDFVGKIRLVIDYGRYKEPGSFRQSGEYNGVCNWDTLSHETRELHRILKRRIKWWANEK